MSLLTTLAYAITAAIRPKVREADLARMQSQIDDLNRKADNLLADMTRQRDDWRALAMRYRDELHAGPAPQRHFIDEEMRLRMQAQMLGAQAQMQQYSMQQNAYTMQNFDQQLDEYVRNCTPGRHELFTRG